MKRFVLLLSILLLWGMPVSVQASENDILDAILAEEEKQQELWEQEIAELEEFGVLGYRNNPIKTQITCYIEPGQATCTGSKKMDGIIAAAPEYVGYVAQVYKVAEDGSIGEFLGYFEVEDTGYGAPTGMGKSIYKNRKSAGTIEMGLTVDFRKPNMKAAKEFMKINYTGEGQTGSEVYITLERGDG